MRVEAWSDDDVTLLKKLWIAGETAQAIAEKLGGISRSAVLGKIFRLRLGPADAGKKPDVQAAVAMGAREATKRRRCSFCSKKPSDAGAERQGKTLFELTNHCCRCANESKRKCRVSPCSGSSPNGTH